MSERLPAVIGDGESALQVVWGGLSSLLSQAVSGELDAQRISDVKAVIDLASSAADVEEKMSRAGVNRARAYATFARTQNASALDANVEAEEDD